MVRLVHSLRMLAFGPVHGVSRHGLTIDARTLRLRISKRVVRRSWRLVETGWALRLKLSGHGRLTWLFLRWWCKTRPTLTASACHDALEEVRWTVANGGRWRLRWACVGTLGWSAALL